MVFFCFLFISISICWKVKKLRYIDNTSMILEKVSDISKIRKAKDVKIKENRGIMIDLSE